MINFHQKILTLAQSTYGIRNFHFHEMTIYYLLYNLNLVTPLSLISLYRKKTINSDNTDNRGNTIATTTNGFIFTEHLWEEIIWPKTFFAKIHFAKRSIGKKRKNAQMICF